MSHLFRVNRKRQVSLFPGCSTDGVISDSAIGQKCKHAKSSKIIGLELTNCEIICTGKDFAFYIRALSLKGRSGTDERTSSNRRLSLSFK